MGSKYIKISYEDKIANVCLSRSEKANAINEDMWENLSDLFIDLSSNKDVRVIILSAEGKNFCSGIELSMLENLLNNTSECEGRTKERLRSNILKLQKSISQIEACSKPVIATVQGACIGGGVDLITACDFRYATESSYFSVKEAALGITADLGTLQRLPLIVGQGTTREWAYTCKKISALEAKQKGLLNDIFSEQTSMQVEALKTAKLIASHPPLAIRGTKHILNYSRDHSIDNSLNYVATWNSAVLPSSEIKEAMKMIKGSK
ncbi:MAG: crotonase/enoyl-CoA hydratase family protein [Oligoflexales bacterium]